MSLMRKIGIAVLISVLLVGMAVAAATAWAQRDNAYRVNRAREIVRELQRLEIGHADLSVADAIAKRFGSAPVPRGFTRYPNENCASPDHNGSCYYILSMNNSPIEELVLEHQWVSRLVAQDWYGYVEVVFTNGTLSQYSYWVWYKASNGMRRGVGSRLGKMLPKYEPFQAHISESYSIERSGGRVDEGILLESSLTPNATTDEWHRASHIDLSCLGKTHGCGEICEIMPEAWLDFYVKRGQLDAEHLGPG